MPYGPPMSEEERKKKAAVLIKSMARDLDSVSVRREIERQLEENIIDEVEAGMAASALNDKVAANYGLGASIEDLRELSGLPRRSDSTLSSLEEDFASVGLTIGQTKKTIGEMRETMEAMASDMASRKRKRRSWNPFSSVSSIPIPPIPPIPPIRPITPWPPPPAVQPAKVYDGVGVNAIGDLENDLVEREKELVTNPNSSYREPSKIHFGDLLDKAGLDFRRTVEVYSRGYDSRTTLAEQKELIDSLNKGQNDVTFVLIRPKPRRKWWERLFRLRAKKDTIAEGPCGCYPCNCELFCHKLSLPEKKR